jgi:hypothetical protein
MAERPRRKPKSISDFEYTVATLERRGLTPELAQKLARAMPALRRAFPEPSPEKVEEILKVVAETTWAEQNWNHLFNQSSTPELKSKFRNIGEQIVTGLVSSGLWALICYLYFLLRGTGGLPGLHAVPPIRSEGETIHQFNIDLLNSQAFASPNDETLSEREIAALLLAVEPLFEELDTAALADPQLDALTRARVDAADAYQSPSQTLFNWLRPAQPKTVSYTPEQMAELLDRMYPIKK